MLGQALQVGLLSRLLPIAERRDCDCGISSVKAARRDLHRQVWDPSAHAEIYWSMSGGGGSVGHYQSPTEHGVASMTVTLGQLRRDTYTATIIGQEMPYTSTETAVVGPPAIMSKTSGNYQQGEPGVPLANPLVAQVTDAYGNPLSGVRVSWTANTPGDALSQSSNSTATYGHSDDTLTLGPAYGVHTVNAFVAGTAIGQTFVATHGITVGVQSNPHPNPNAMEPYFLGLSYPKTWVSVDMFDPNNAATVALFKDLGPGVLRFLAESTTGAIPWDPDGAGLKYGVTTTADIKRVAAFVKAANWKVLYGIGLLNTTTSAAASEAAVAAKEFGSNLLGFEIGNEPSTPLPSDVWRPPGTPDTWLHLGRLHLDDAGLLQWSTSASWPAYADAIRAAVPNAPLAAAASGPSWAIDIAESGEASKVSLLTIHYYAEWPAEPATMTGLFDSRPKRACVSGANERGRGSRQYPWRSPLFRV